MSFTQTKNHKQYKISLKTVNGNTVGFINLSSQFTKAVLGKSDESITVADILAVNNEDFQGFIDQLLIEVETVVPDSKIDIKDF